MVAHNTGVLAVTFQLYEELRGRQATLLALVPGRHLLFAKPRALCPDRWASTKKLPEILEIWSKLVREGFHPPSRSFFQLLQA